MSLGRGLHMELDLRLGLGLHMELGLTGRLSLSLGLGQRLGARWGLPRRQGCCAPSCRLSTGLGNEWSGNWWGYISRGHPGFEGIIPGHVLQQRGQRVDLQINTAHLLPGLWWGRYGSLRPSLFLQWRRRGREDLLLQSLRGKRFLHRRRGRWKGTS